MSQIDLNGWSLRPEYQQPIHDLTIKHLRESEEPAVISASVGAGKTINIAAIAKHIDLRGGRVLVLARQGELVEQNSSKGWRVGLKSSVFSASLGQRSTHYRVIMGTEGTVANALTTTFRYDDKVDPKTLIGFFHALLIDECHHVDWQDTEKCIDAMRSGKDYLTNDYSQYARIIAHCMKINPKIRIIGYTGSPYRGTTDIIGTFWKKKLYDVPTMYLVELGYLVPPVFGFGDDSHKYDMSEFLPSGQDGTNDFSSKELAAMQRIATRNKTLTQAIIEEVVERTKDRNGVLITCAGRKHCEQVAEFLPKGSWSIITDKTSTKERRQALIDARTGKKKYTIQIGCLTTGVDIPTWDTCVILRRIGSLTLLTQLTGRVLRILEKEDIDRGFTKSDALILDYTDTFESFGDIYDDPLLNKAQAEKSKGEGKQQECPLCSTMNSEWAVRCIGHDDSSDDDRCEHFFKGAMCLACNTMNAPSAQSCRKCEAIMIDPSKALKGKAYSDDEYKPVKRVRFEAGQKNGLLWVIYDLDSVIYVNGEGKPEVAREFYYPFSDENHHKQRWLNFVNSHINGYKWRKAALNMRTVTEIIKNKAIFDKPTHITHRIGKNNNSIIARRKFLSGREAK